MGFSVRLYFVWQGLGIVYRVAPSLLLKSGLGLYRETVAPVAYQVILEPGVGQFREFESARVHTRINSWVFFSCAQIDLRKARERELSTLDVKSTSSGIAERYAR